MASRNGRYERDICYGWNDVGVTFVTPPTATCRSARVRHRPEPPDIT
ncbi:hypothetical protein [Streptomyces malaysiensis]|uniref:Uncharacterized protein n=1 Tax=Streptomyces malaysiensis subsp. samsunensis TaxID=459658 RepID=A0A9X2M163_STRMQ|nr:hypothetical protein [Streptomyces samsunensis]MCQ8833746.1 hypothetical protein [Streptomyces samsunensis]